LNTKEILKKKAELLDKDSKAAKGIHKNSVTPTKEHTCESWASKKDKKCNPKRYAIYSTK
jgi:hypothetical protein